MAEKRKARVCHSATCLKVHAVMSAQSSCLPWLEPGAPFPTPDQAWGQDSPAPGLLAVGGDLTVATLRRAYRVGIFPWFSAGDPILWWSPQPRMVLHTAQFKLHHSLRKTLHKFRHSDGCEIRFDSCFSDVILACSARPRQGKNGTWIVPAMRDAYQQLHEAGLAHSVETWVGGRMVGGLYLVAMGRAVFGESMFSDATDASKIALAALVGFCRANAIEMIDCQQNTRHLSSLGATEITRENFLAQVAQACDQAAVAWRFEPVYWNQLTATSTPL